MHWNTRHHGLLRSSLLESLAPTLKSDTRRFGQTIGTVNRLASLDCSEPLTLCSYCMPSSGEVAVCFSDCWMCSWLNIESRFRNSDRMKSCSSEHVTLRQDRKSSLRGLFKTTSRLALYYNPSSGPRQLCHCWKSCSGPDYWHPSRCWRGPLHLLFVPPTSHHPCFSLEPSPPRHHHRLRSRNSSLSHKLDTPRTLPKEQQTDTPGTPPESVSVRSAQAENTSSPDALSSNSAERNGSPARTARLEETTPSTLPRPAMCGITSILNGTRTASILESASRRKGSCPRPGTLPPAGS